MTTGETLTCPCPRCGYPGKDPRSVKAGSWKGRKGMATLSKAARHEIAMAGVEARRRIRATAKADVEGKAKEGKGVEA